MAIMSFSGESKKFAQAVRKASAPLLTGVLLFNSGNILETISDTNFDRHIAPEPFDFPSHIGNFREASMATTGAYVMIGIFTLLRPLIEGPPEVLKRNAKVTAVAAFAVSTAVQVIGEKYGITNSIHAINTPDPLDAAYGVGWSAITAVAAYGGFAHATRPHDSDTSPTQVPRLETKDTI
jgi:hypothetical protein